MLQVLSHHMSPGTAKLYEAAQDGELMSLRVLQFYEDCDPHEWGRKFRSTVEQNVQQYLIT